MTAEQLATTTNDLEAQSRRTGRHPRRQYVRRSRQLLHPEPSSPTAARPPARTPTRADSSDICTPARPRRATHTPTRRLRRRRAPTPPPQSRRLGRRRGQRRNRNRVLLTGKPTTSGGSSPTENIGGLVGHKHASAPSPIPIGIRQPPKSPPQAPERARPHQLQTPTAYCATNTCANTDIYEDWDIDLDSVTTGTQDGWDFGTASQYPALDYGLTAADQRASIAIAVSPTTICETTKGTDANACGASPVTASTLTATISPAQEVPITLDISEIPAEYRLKSGSTYTTELVIAAGATTGTLTVEAVNNTTDASDNDRHPNARHQPQLGSHALNRRVPHHRGRRPLG